MKKMIKKRLGLILTTTIISCFMGFSQIPNKISYQSVIRNSQGQLVLNSNVGLRFSILPDTTGSAPIYVETSQKATNGIGLLVAQIGGGTPVSGSFASINWGANTYFLRMEADPSGGSNYTLNSYAQLLSVPYAFAARTANSVIGLSDSITNIVSTMSSFSGNYQHLTNKPNIKDTVLLYSTGNDYNNLINKPNLNDSITNYINTTGISYTDLTNQPSINDSVSNYISLNGVDYTNLTNQPNFQDSIMMYSTGNDYNMLTNRPSFNDSISNYISSVGIDYTNLANQPNFQDSITMYGFDGNYNSLTNKPSLNDSITNYINITGISYTDLTNQPSINDSVSNYISLNGVDYTNLTNQPNIKDSVLMYSTGNDYNTLINRPSFNDSISNYISSVGINYTDLTNQPNIKDSISTYGFNGDYTNLTNIPNIKDSVTLYSTNSIVRTNGSVTFPLGSTIITNPVSNQVYPLNLSGSTPNLANAPKLTNGTQQASFLGNSYTTTNGTITYQGGTATSVAGLTGSRILENGIKGQMHSFRIKIGWDKANNTNATFAIILYNPDSGFTYRVSYTPQANLNTNGATIYIGGVTADSVSIGKGYVIFMQATYTTGSVNTVQIYEVKMISDFSASESNV